jgi:hypothetical protein
MFSVGQKVVCIDDNFPAPIAKYYVALPKKNVTYSIRQVYVARAIMHPATRGAADGEIGVLLEELSNPPDPRNMHHQELGFKAERFKPLDELVDKDEYHETDAVSAGNLVPAGH